MADALITLLPLDVDQLLEQPAFRDWARSDRALPESIASHPAAATNFRTAQSILRGIDGDVPNTVPTASEKMADFAALEALIQAEPQVKTAKTIRLWPRLLAVAATVALLLTAGFFLLRPAPSVEYATGNSERLEITLPDGTAVTLNANSRLQMADNDWGGGDRDVTLTGEAYFDVAKQESAGKKRPFKVHTSGAVIHVLGTRFNVKNRRGADRVYLEEGSVRIGWTGANQLETELRPGEMAFRDLANAQPVHVPAFKPAGEVAWRSGHLLFNRRPLQEALAEVSDIYGIELRCTDPELSKREVTSTGIPMDDLQLALRLLGNILDLKIEASENSSTYLVTAAE